MRLEKLEPASVTRSTWVEVDLGALAGNFGRVRELVGRRRVWCVVKADAYGHGAVDCARKLQDEGADSFAVATVDEGAVLRDAGITGRVLVMAGIEPVEAPEAGEAAALAAEHSLEVAVWRSAAAEVLAAAARERGTEALLHLKLDTGMGRLGVLVDDDFSAAVAMASAIAGTEGARLEGVFSNLGAADAEVGSPGDEHAKLQAARFAAVCSALEASGLEVPERHLSNSAAVLQHPESWDTDWCTGVRPGLSLCGVPFAADAVTIELEPVMSWYSRVAAVREVPAGWPLGYGSLLRAAQQSTIAVVPVGYHDGFSRALSDHAEVLVGGRRAQVVGAISMDLTLVDITGHPEVHEGAPVVLLGSQEPGRGESITAHDLAKWGGSIAHEMLCRIGARVPRRTVDCSP